MRRIGLAKISGGRDRRLEMRANKLRVATPDSSSALDVLTAQVHLATGLGVKAEFQEIDHESLIVELRLAEADERPPRWLAQLVEEASTGLEVLSSWRETDTELTTQASPRPQVVTYADPALPRVVQRAFDDHLPTAGWQPSSEYSLPHWLLAVPAVVATGQVVAGVKRRNGYSHRFTVADATTIRNRLVA
jgi:hypothetical protein